MSEKTRKLAVFPAFHKVAGRRVVIVGGGAEAAAKIRLLSETCAEIVVFAATLESSTGADLIAAHGDWRGAFPAAADLSGAALVFAATGSEESDREVSAMARAAGVPVNAVDRPGALRFLHAGPGQPGAARGRHRQRGRGTRAHPPGARPHRGDAGAGTGRSCRPGRDTARPRAHGADLVRRSPPLLGEPFSPAPSPRRSLPAVSPRPRTRRCGRWRSIPACRVMCRWLVPGRGRRIC